MSRTRVKSLRTVVAVRKRHQTRLEEDLLAQRRELLALQQAAEAARAFQQACEDQQAQAQHKRDDLIGSGFAPEALIALDHRLQTLASNTAQAGQQLQARLRSVDSQNEKITAVQRALLRNARRIEAFNDQIDRIAAGEVAAEDERNDEEADEGASMRLCVRRQHEKGLSHGRI